MACKKEAQGKMREAPRMQEELGILVLGREVPSPQEFGLSDPVHFSPPQNKPSSYQSPTSGPTLYKFIVTGPVRKPRPYSYNLFSKIY